MCRQALVTLGSDLGEGAVAKNDKIQKWLGPPVNTIEDLRIHAKLMKPKTTRGRPHVWLVIKQNRDSKRWRMSECLAYADSVHIKFMPKDPPAKASRTRK
jgi:hypothetical protein